MDGTLDLAVRNHRNGATYIVYEGDTPVAECRLGHTTTAAMPHPQRHRDEEFAHRKRRAVAYRKRLMQVRKGRREQREADYRHKQRGGG